MPVEKVPIALILDSDKCLRVWVMRPFLAGKHLSFDRVLKCEIDPKPMEMAPILSVMKFFWKLKVNGLFRPSLLSFGILDLTVGFLVNSYCLNDR